MSSAAASVLAEAAPGDLGVGEDHGRHRQRLEGGGLIADGVDRDGGLVARLVREHRLAGDIADGEDVGLGGAALEVGFDETALVDQRAGLLQSQSGAVGAASGGDQYAVVGFRALHAVGAAQHRADAVGGFLDRGHGRFELNRVEVGPQAALEHRDELAIDAAEQLRQQFDNGDARAERGVDRAELEPM